MGILSFQCHGFNQLSLFVLTGCALPLDFHTSGNQISSRLTVTPTITLVSRAAIVKTKVFGLVTGYILMASGKR